MVVPKQLPALIFAILVQAGGIVWWASAQARDNYFLAERVATLEAGFTRASEGQTQMMERLARIEERVNAQLGVLDRIEKQVAPH